MRIEWDGMRFQLSDEKVCHYVRSLQTIKAAWTDGSVLISISYEEKISHSFQDVALKEHSERSR